MIQLTCHPLGNWTWPRTKTPRRAPFSAPWHTTLAQLDTELRYLRARDAALLVDLDPGQIRKDGWPYSHALPRTSGVVLSFTSKHGALTYPCDTYSHWQHNIRAIALGLAALRAVDRYGVTARGEQYTGWKALPCASAPAARPFETVLEAAMYIGTKSGTGLNGHRIIQDENAAREAYFAAVKKLHPDAGGSKEDFLLLQEAKALVEAALA